MTLLEEAALKEAVFTHLYSIDIRRVFLRSNFIQAANGYNISHWYAEKNLFEWFKQRKMLGSLMACMNTVFGLSLTMTNVHKLKK